MTAPDRLVYNSKAQTWEFHSRPHIRARLRRLFNAKSAERGHFCTIAHNEANAVDVAWILERYPHTVEPFHAAFLRQSVNAAKEREALTESILSGVLTSEPLPLKFPLRPYQLQAVELTLAVRGLLCGDDLGLGKTLVGIGLAASPDAGQSVIVCPPHLQRQWVAQFRKFAPQMRVEIAKTVKPYATRAEVLIIPYSKIEGWAGHVMPRTIVFDEVHELRHKGTKKYDAAKLVAETAEYRLGLSATPVFNYGGESFNVINILRPEALGTEEEFLREWCSSYVGGKPCVDDPPALGAYLREQSLMLRRTRADVGKELPPITLFSHEVKYSEDVMKRLTADALQHARMIVGTSGSFEEKGNAARQLDLKLRQATGIAKAPFVAAFVADLVKAGKKVLLAGWHRDVYDIWAHEFKLAEVPYGWFTGEESTAAKDAAVEQFKKAEGGAVLIMSLRSGAGLDGLQEVADTVVVGELDWSPQVHTQLFGRLQRDGQFNPDGITAIYLVADGGSDPIIASILGVKLEQGHGITDPGLDIETLPTSQALTTNQPTTAPANRIRDLAVSFLNRYNNAA